MELAPIDFEKMYAISSYSGNSGTTIGKIFLKSRGTQERTKAERNEGVTLKSELLSTENSMATSISVKNSHFMFLHSCFPKILKKL